MATSLLINLNKISDVSQYINSNDPDALYDNLLSLNKKIYEYGQHKKNYKKSNKKSRNLSDNLLVTNDFGPDEIWSQIKNHSHSVLSSIAQRSKYRKNERQRMQQILTQLQNDANNDSDNSDSDDLGDLMDKIQIEQFQSNGNQNENNEKQSKQSPEKWIDFIKENRQNQLETPKESESKIEKEDVDDDILDFDSFQKETDKMEQFINAQWNKEQEMAQNENFDMFQRALMFDEEAKNEQKSEKSEKEIDDFSFLNQHIIKDSDDEEPNENDKNSDNEWNDLFNLPKITQSNNEQTAAAEVIDDELKEKMEKSDMSKFELEELAIKQRIAKMEQENVKQRSWEFQGEVSNNSFTHPNAKRSQNSLLSTYLDFDYSDKLKPQITEDLNQSIENLIITKIKNNSFDDVEKKTDFANAPKIAKRKLIEIQDTKSSMGLAELYEREYLQQIDEKQKNMDNNEDFESSKDAELQKQYERISRLKSTLFYELDQLIRFHYEPKRAVIAGNVKVKTHTKALHLEEILPFSMSNEQMTMTPEQLYRKPRKLAHIKGDNEMSKSDRKKKRAANKKRGKHWKMLRNENDKFKAKYDAKFAGHLSRIKALNEVRTHAIAAAKKNGFLNKNAMDVSRDDTHYTSSKQMFAKIQKHKDEEMMMKKRKMENCEQLNNATPPDKKRKIMSMMH